MSDEPIQARTAVEDRDWDAVLARLRADGFSPVDSIKVTRAVLQVSLAEAKRLVHESPAWTDQREAWDELHDAAVLASADLAH
jgi:ribosomal protein L7/L12